MKNLNSLANDMLYGDIVGRIAKERNIGLTEARTVISEMSFSQYRLLTELITPPSGQTIGPIGSTGSSNLAKPTPTAQPSPMTKGQAAASGGLLTPPKIGDTVNVPGPNNVPIPVQLTRVDTGKNTVRYKSPITGRDEDIGVDKLSPAATSNNSPDSGNAVAGPATAGTPGLPPTGGTGQVTEDAELARLLELAGIPESCSGGASGVGGIAVSATPMGKPSKKVIRRTEEGTLNTQYKRKRPEQTIAGDRKPLPGMHKLNADLSATPGKSAAGSAFNGKREKRVR